MDMHVCTCVCVCECVYVHIVYKKAINSSVHISLRYQLICVMAVLCGAGQAILMGATQEAADLEHRAQPPGHCMGIRSSGKARIQQWRLLRNWGLNCYILPLKSVCLYFSFGGCSCYSDREYPRGEET